MSIVEQIKALPNAFIHILEPPISGERLKALVESHERLLKAAKDARDGIDQLDYDLEYKRAAELETALQAAIEEAEKL